MSQITEYVFIDNGKNNSEIYAASQSFSHGCYHSYKVVNKPHFQFVDFQQGPVKEYGANGCSIEDLLIICKNRLEMLQNTNYSCNYNEKAIQGISEALQALIDRNNDRSMRGVLGTSEI